MAKVSVSLGKPLLLGACLCVAITGRSAAAYAHSSTYVREVPSHLVVNDQLFDASPAGFRAYLETIKDSNGPLYAQLAPDVDRLESRTTTARTMLAAGLGLGLGLTIAGIVTRQDCQGPAVTDPDFAAKAEAWGACNRDNMSRMETFGLIGMAVATGGVIGALVTAPRRGDLLDLVNKHNRASADPMRLQIGYDPSRRFAHVGASIAF